MGRSQLLGISMGRGGQLERHTGYLGTRVPGSQPLGGTLGAGASLRSMEDSVLGFGAWKRSGLGWGSREAQYEIPRLGCRKCAGGGRCQNLGGCVLQVLEGMKEDQGWKGTQLQGSCVLGDKGAQL